MEDVLETTQLPLLDTLELRRSWRIVKAPDWFMFLIEFVSNEYDLDPSSYNEDISDKDLKNWQSDMKVIWSLCTLIMSENL